MCTYEFNRVWVYGLWFSWFYKQHREYPRVIRKLFYRNAISSKENQPTTGMQMKQDSIQNKFGMNYFIKIACLNDIFTNMLAN